MKKVQVLTVGVAALLSLSASNVLAAVATAPGVGMSVPATGTPPSLSTSTALVTSLKGAAYANSPEGKAAILGLQSFDKSMAFDYVNYAKGLATKSAMNKKIAEAALGALAAVDRNRDNTISAQERADASLLSLVLADTTVALQGYEVAKPFFLETLTEMKAANENGTTINAVADRKVQNKKGKTFARYAPFHDEFTVSCPAQAAAANGAKAANDNNLPAKNAVGY